MLYGTRVTSHDYNEFVANLQKVKNLMIDFDLDNIYRNHDGTGAGEENFITSIENTLTKKYYHNLENVTILSDG